LVMVPFAEYQLATAGAPSDGEPSLFRRFMRMTAEALAPQFGAHAVSTGDSLSQAASQTLWNIGVFDRGSALPILRPLLAYDKQEIIELAEKIDTYDLSIQDYKDCCAIVTRHPKTRVRLDLIERLAARYDFAALVQRCLREATVYTFDPSTGTSKTSPFGAREAAPPLGE
jgi:tRNA uracil 4-sulfurtransferase